MKKISNITLVALIALSTVSCQDWLEMPSENKFESGTIFETISRAESVVLGCYPQTFNAEMFYQLGMGSDACISTEGETNSKNQMANYVYTTSNAPAGCYTAMFKGIEFANVAIKGLRNMTASSNAEQTKINMLLGEALAIRGLNYSNLVRFYGDVPHPMLPFADLGTFNLSRVDRDIIYDDCIKDLQEATDLLPWKSAGLIVSPERFTKNAAYGILARVALYAAGTSLRWDLKTYDPATLKLAQRSDKTRIKELYKIAADACEKVINQKENKLIKYETVFRNLVQTKYNEEMMLTFGQMGENVNGLRTGYTNGMFCHTNSVFGKAGPAMVALSTYYYDFEEGDTRRDVAICNYGITSGNIRKMNNYVNNTIGKFRVTWKEEGGTAASKRDISFPILRYSDVLLMYAEALNEYNNQPTPAAIQALKDVRMRAFNDDETKIGTIPSSYADFKTAIIKERKLELAFEGLRRSDLIRWGILAETLQQTKKDLIEMANKTGRYTNIDSYRAYKQEKSLEFNEKTIALSFIGFKAEPSEDEKAKLEKEGYTIVDMFGIDSFKKDPLNFTNKLGENEAWVKGLYRGMLDANLNIVGKNKLELVPLNTKSIIDVSPGLAGQQHPAF